jgi:glycerophosphoryl diester phosphodiesterase
MLMPAFDDPQPDARLKRPLVIAHRGASALAPENTLAAFSLAIALGADGVEMDVQMSADGRPVVIHDARVSRTTNGAGTVSRLTLDQLQRLDAGSWFERRLSRRPRVRAMVGRISAEAGAAAPRYSGEPVPSLEDVLSLLKPAGLERIYVELKGTPANQQTLLNSVLALVRKLGVDRATTLLSFDLGLVRRAKELASDVRTAALFPAKGRRLISARSIVRSAKSAGVDEVALHFGLATQRSIEAFHERGLSVSVWTANSKLAMRRIVACGADSIMTNFPNRLRDVIELRKVRQTVRGHRR